MPTTVETVERIASASSFDQRVAEIGRIPHVHGTDEHPHIYAALARQLYVPYLAPDFAYIHANDFYDREYFERVYQDTYESTAGFVNVSEDALAAIIEANPRTLLVLRVILGLVREEFAASTRLVAQPDNLAPLTGAKVDSMERDGSRTTAAQARVAAKALCRIMDGSLFGTPPGGVRSKQEKPDTEHGWHSVQQFAAEGVPFALFLHQRHYGGSFRQILDATSTKRGNLIEDAVEALFRNNGIHYLQTGSHNQGDIQARFHIMVTPAPDFVVYDEFNGLRAMLECKGANDGGTARDKASRFGRLKAESVRLSGIPLIAVLAGLGWARVNDTLGPVLRDTQGRVFTLATLPQMLTMAPFPSLMHST